MRRGLARFLCFHVPVSDPIEKVKAEFERLRPSLSLEAQSLFSLMLSLLEILVSKKRPTSSNSHLPPSQDPHRKRPRKGGKRRPGGQPGHKGASLEKAEHPDEEIQHRPQACSSCLKDLSSKAEIARTEKRQVFEAKLSRYVVEHQGLHLRCSCGCITAPVFPPQAQAPLQYGPSAKALAVYLHWYQLLPLARTCEFFAQKLNLPLSEATVMAMGRQAHERLAVWDAQIRDQLLAANVLHADETGINVDAKGNWLHVLSNEYLTYIYGHAKRGRQAVEQADILTQYKGVLVHDCWPTYFQYDCTHAICNAHILRELTWAQEQEGQAWAGKLKKLLLDACHEGREWNHDKIKRVERKYERILEEGDQECPRSAPSGKKGRTKQSKSRNLLERLRLHQSSVLLFLYDPMVPFTNNQGERDLRMAKLRQKISGGFRTSDGMAIFCRLRSYVATMRKQGVMPRAALLQVFS